MRTVDVHRILGIDEQFKAPGRIMEILWDRGERERVFREFLECDPDLSFDGFHEYFEQEQADRKVHKQDYTPDGVSRVLSRLAGLDGESYDPTAGTGGLLIVKWWRDCTSRLPFDYRPSEHLYWATELSDRAFPFLLFNLLIRGMNAVAIHGDVLEATARGVFLIQNDRDDALAFSCLNLMPYDDQVLEFLGLRGWTGEPYPAHVESQWPPAALADMPPLDEIRAAGKRARGDAEGVVAPPVALVQPGLFE